MLEHDTCFGRADFSQVVSWSEGSSSGQRRGGREKPGGCSAVPPPRTRCHQTQLGTSLGHQRVYHGFPSACRAAVCVQTSSGRTPVTGPVSRSVALFLSLIPFHSPMRRTLLRPMFLPLSRNRRLVRAPSFHSVKLVAVDYTGVRLLLLYVFDAIMPQPYDISLTLPTPRGDATLPKALSRRRNERYQAHNFSKFNKAFTFRSVPYTMRTSCKIIFSKILLVYISMQLCTSLLYF